MSKELIQQRILKEIPNSGKKFEVFERAREVESDAEAPENFSQNPNIFLLNNLLLTIQFFENFERDVEILRENWFNEVSLASQQKKCFFADSLFRLSGTKVKFSSLHGINKYSKEFLHPLRIYIFSDNMEAAFDPKMGGTYKKNVWPQYQFRVQMDENDEKLGSVSLVLLKTLEMSKDSFDSTLVNDDLNFPHDEGTKGKKLTKTEKFFTHHQQEFNFKTPDRRISLKCVKGIQDEMIPPNAFYCFATPEESLHSVSIAKYRMNRTRENNQEIPRQCFQREMLETTLETRRIPNEKFVKERRVLNAAAFKGHFCDTLIQKLAEPLGFDVEEVQRGIIHEEFVIFGQEKKIFITHGIEISDWKNFISLTGNRHNTKFNAEVVWPTNQMWEIMNTLPCYAVPNGVPDLSGKNLDHEKKWKIAFPKTEQFLLLHMMHSQIRCYFFILSIYKSFIESEINTASLGPQHLLHLFFWQVHKNFLAWPEERPAETLLGYLQILYKKLQNKFLRDFFINSRNLFASSLAKDMHKAQALIKMILQNPVPYILRAIRNLESEANFYPTFEAVKVNAILSPSEIPCRLKKLKKEKIKKEVAFEDMEKQLWRESIKQMRSLLRPKEQEARKNSISSIDTDKIINFDFRDSQKFSRILEMLILHYIEMGRISIKFNFLTQAYMYLFQIQSLFELMNNEKLNKEELKALLQKINKFKEKCNELEREGKLNQSKPKRKTKLFANLPPKLRSQQQMVRIENDTPEKHQKIYEKNVARIKILTRANSSDYLIRESEGWETKL